MKAASLFAGAVSAGAVLASCGTDPVRPGCTEEACLDRAYFQEAVAPLLEKHCAVCHVPGGLAWGSTGLDLTADAAWEGLVDVPSNEMSFTLTPMLRVKPGQPESSYLYLKISRPVPPYGGRMPLSDYTLTGAEIGVFRTWIKGRTHD